MKRKILIFAPSLLVLGTLGTMVALALLRTSEEDINEQNRPPAAASDQQSKTVPEGEPERSQQDRLLERDRANLPAELCSILGDAKYAHGLQGRIYRLDQLSRKPAQPVLLASIQAFLLQSEAPESVSQYGLPALKHEAMNFLRQHGPDPRQTATIFQTIFKDPSQPTVIRDYALQHLAETFFLLPSPERRSVIPLFLEGTDETESSVAGTALLALRHIASKDALEGTITPRLIQNIALGHAADASLPAPTRATAIQVSARLGDKRVLETARAYAADAEDGMLRCAAIAALGELADRHFKVELARLHNHPDIRIRTAARNALARIKATPRS